MLRKLDWKFVIMMRLIFRGLLFCLVLVISLLTARGEGTAQLRPAAADWGDLQVFDRGRPFMTYGCTEPHRLHINICSLGEKIYYGFRQDNNDVYFRIRDPLGNIVVDNGSGAGIPVPMVGEPGFIDTYNECVIGPIASGGAGGYDALLYTPTMVGDYYIEFNPRDSLVVNNVKRVFKFFDITVTDASDVPILGRLWSREWDIQCNGGANRFRGTFYIYSDDGIVTSVDLNGLQPYGFTVAANENGLQNTGNIDIDRQSRNGNINFAQYKIFLNDPDNICFPTGTFGQLTAPSFVTGCGESLCINIEVDKEGTVEIMLDLNGVEGYQTNTTDVLLTADVVIGLNCVPWDGRDGTGNPVANQQFISMEVNYFNGLTHIPLFDIENNDRGYIVRQIRPPGPNPPVFWDDSNLPGGTTEINDGCTDVTGCHLWPSGNFGNDRTINTWWYANVVRDSAFFEYDSANVADANILNGSGNNDTILCNGTTSINLNGGVITATGGEWSGSGGTFDNDTSLSTVYTFDASEITAGFATVILTTTGNGDCPEDKDTMVISLPPAPVANAGPDQFVCENNANMNFTGSVTNATSFEWTGTGGTFIPNNTTLNVSYTPSSSEISSGIAFAILCGDGGAGCPEACDTVLGIITPAPTVDAGIDNIVCANSNIILNGSASGGASIVWSGGDGSFTPLNNMASPTYTPGSNDISSGNLTLSLTASLAGCNPVTDNMILTVTPAPVVDAGADVNRCENRLNYRINDASVTTATGVTWTTSGTGTFNNANRIDPVYRPSNDDVTQGLLGGSVFLTATSTGNGICNAVSDSLEMTFRPAPVVNAGIDQSVCENNAMIQLAGSTNWHAIRWQSSDGSYIPNNRSVTSQYNPSATEIAAGNMFLVLRSHNEQGCRRERDTLNITFTPAPTVDAGPDLVVCSNNSTAQLNGSITLATGAQWSGGSGAYSDENSLTSTYTLTNPELSAGTVNLTLTTTGNATCNAVSDQVRITVDPDPIVNAGPNQVVCENNPDISLSGNIQNAAGGTWSAGGGVFTPDANTLNATYTPTAAEINSGSITFTLTSTGNGNCQPESDQMVVNFSSAPTANAGPDVVLCANNSNMFLSGALLNGSIIAASGGVWSSTGTGTFTPNEFDLNANYVPSQGDTAVGLVTLKLETTGNGGCLPEQDSMELSFTSAPVVNAGIDQSICADNPQVSLNGTVTVANGGIWTGGTGSFNPDNTTLSTIYTATADNITNGFVTLTLTSTGNGDCNPVDDNITISITPAPTVNAGPNQSVCGATTTINLNGSVTVANGARWTTNGSGSFSPNDSTLNAQYISNPADKTAGSVILTLTTYGNGLCNPVTDDMTITFTPTPVVDAGTDEIVCTNSFPIQLDASGGAGQWTGGSGNYSPNQFTLNATYEPDALEITAGNVGPLTYCTFASPGCPSICDDVSFTIPAGPTVNAGPDQNICDEGSPISLNGSYTNAAGVQWTTQGSGSFVDIFNPITTYDYSNADINSGSVRLFITTTGNGSCQSERDTIDISITPGVIVNAGPDQTFCASATSAQLSGIVVNAGGGQWTTLGSGTFNPNNTSLNASYQIHANDVSAGQVQVVLESTGNGICIPRSDTATFTFQVLPIVDAGPDHTLCKDTSSIELFGSVTNALGADWTTSGNGFFAPNANTLNTSYYPSSNDTTGNSLRLYLTSSGNGVCPAVVDSTDITFTTVPTVNGGNNLTVCADAGAINLSGLITIATGGIWTTSGTGAFSSNTDLNGTYTPSVGDINNGLAVLTLESTGNGDCMAYSDNVLINITPAPTANAGADQFLCSDTDTTNIFGQVTIASGGLWSTSGTGTFDPSNTDLGTSYVPSSGDKSSLSIDLVLETTGNGLCNPARDTLQVIFTTQPTVDAGVNQIVCADTGAVQLGGNVINALGGEWRSGGSGSFSPSINDLNATYIPSSSDIDSGTVRIYLESIGNGSCDPIVDSMEIIITPVPIVNAGLNQLVCSNEDSVYLDGTHIISSGVVWTTSGTGSFSPSSSDTNAIYIPSALDDQSGVVNLTLTTTGNGLCNAVTDQISINITNAPEINAGSDRTICASEDFITLNATMNSGYVSTWSGGNGAFVTSVYELDPNYFPTTSEKALGSVSLIIKSSNGNGVCLDEADTMVISFDQVPTISAGNDLEVCNNITNVSLSGISTNSTGILWNRSGTGSFSPSSTTLNSSYLPSAADLASDSVILYLSSTGTGTCATITDTLILYIDPEPIISAGPDQVLCSDFDGAQLDGTIQNADGVVWTTSGDGTFVADSTTVDPIYNATANDKSFNTINFTITSSGTGACNSVSDNMRITIEQEPTVDAGDDKLVCTSADTIILSGLITNAGGAFWDVFGTGTYDPSNNSSSVKYIPSAADITGDSLLASLTTTGTGACNPIEDRITIYFVDSSSVNAGVDQVACTNDFPTNVNASGSLGYWTNGNGMFDPDTNSQSINYTPSASEITIGFVDLVFSTVADGTCLAVSDTVRISIQSGPTVSVGVDQTICADTTGLELSPTFTNATGVLWSASGTGTFNPDNTTPNAIYSPSTQDVADSLIIIRVETTGNSGCTKEVDELNLYINPAPTISAGFDQSYCANVSNISLSGSVTNASGVMWTSSGSGGFTNATSTTTDYGVTIADTSSGQIEIYIESTGNGLCRTVYDTVDISFQSVPTIDALSPLSVCEDTSEVALTINFDNASGIQMSRVGNGVFLTSNVDPNGRYQLSTTDITNGTAQIDIVTTGNGICPAANESINITIDEVPTIDVGLDQEICSTTSSINVVANFTVAGGIMWSSSGNGMFGSNNNPTTTYSTSITDNNNGVVTISATTLANGVCPGVSDYFNLDIISAPVASAGPDNTVCANDSVAQLNGSIQMVSNAVWSTNGDGSFNPSTTNLNPTYSPSTNDVGNGAIEIYLTSDANGICPADIDTMNLTIVPSPIVDPGVNQTYCSDISSFTLNGAVTNAGGGSWSSSGSGFFSNINDLNSEYTPSGNDKSTGFVVLTLESVGNGTCLAEENTILITLTPAPTINAGNDISICVDSDTLYLLGDVSVASGADWSTSGTGVFSPSISDLQAQYIPSTVDRNNGFINFILTSTGNGLCNAVNDNMVVTFTPSPVVNAGPDVSICSNNPNTNLSGSVTISSGGEWSGGTGNYIGGSDQLNLTYVPTSTEIVSGSLDMVLSSTGNGSCKAQSDTMEIIFTPSPIVTIDSTGVCGDAIEIELNGNVVNAGGGVWSSSGAGPFSPSNSNLAASYFPTTTDYANGFVVLTLNSTSNGNCLAENDQLNVVFNPLPVSNAGSDKLICTGTEVDLIGQSQANVSYTWYTVNSQAFANTALTTVIGNSDTSFVLSVSDGIGCTTYDTVLVRVQDRPNFNMLPYHCYNDTLVINTNVSNIPPVIGGFQWFRNDTILLNEIDSTLEVNGLGTHIVSYSFANCSVYDTTEVVLPPETIGGIVYDCENSTSDLIAVDLEQANYNWLLSGISQQNGPLNRYAHTYSSSDTVMVEITDSLGCLSIDSFYISPVPSPVFTTQDTTVCSSTIVLIDGDPSNNIDTTNSNFSWYLNGSLLQDTSSIVSASNAGSYVLVYSLGQCEVNDTTVVNHLPIPTPNFERLVKYCDETDLEVSISGDSNYGIFWQGYFDSLTTQKADTAGMYYLTHVSNNGCITNDSIEVRDVCPPRLYIPDGMFVNGGNSHGLGVTGAHFTNYNLTIFNRWGEIIFRSTDSKEIWDGYYLDEPMPSGVYAYVVTYEGTAEEFKGPFMLEGSITVVR